MEEAFFGEGRPDQLYASRHSIVSHEDGENQGGQAKEVGGGAGAGRFENVHGRLAVWVSGGAEGGGEDDGVRGQGFEEGGAEMVAAGENGGESGGVHGRGGVAHEFEAGPGAFAFAAVDIGAKGLGDEVDEEVAPEAVGFVERSGVDGFDGMAELLEEGGGAVESFAAGRLAGEVIGHEDGAGVGRRGERGGRDGKGVANIVALECLKQDFEIACGSGERPSHAHEAGGVGDFGPVSAGGDAAGRGLESAEPAEVGGDADGTATVAANAGRGHAGGDGRGFAAGRAAGGKAGVERMVDAAGDAVVGFVEIEELGAGGAAEEDGAGIEETLDGGGMAAGDFVLAEEGAAPGDAAGEVERVLDGDGDAGEGTGAGLAGLGEGLLFVKFCESVDGRVDALDVVDVCLNQFEGREAAVVEEVAHLLERQAVGHRLRLPDRMEAVATLTFAEARACVLERVKQGRKRPTVERVSLPEAAGRVLACEVRADRDYPPQPRSMRDGFALKAAELPGEFAVVGEVRAGQACVVEVSAGEAVEIMTGASVPAGADAVVMVEHTRVEGSRVKVDRVLEKGANINAQGCDALAGDVVLSAGQRIGVAETALLATVGACEVEVFARPRVAIVATGDELVEIDRTPEPHQIRNSNSWSLAQQVVRAGGEAVVLAVAPDDLAETQARIGEALECDLVLLSGGVSAGKYDVVEQALAHFGAEFYFDRVKLQPGQPCVFGRAGETFFFGLPGNPASTLVCFETLARAAVELVGGCEESLLRVTWAPLGAAFRHKGGLTRFLPARIEADGKLRPVQWSGSGDVAALARANCLLVADAEKEEYAVGEMMGVLAL